MGPSSNERDLLCETCGYDIGGISTPGQCPECGRGVESSWPERRAGSPWQARESVRSWVVTNYLMLRRPREMFDRLRVDGRGLRRLLLVNLALAAILLAAPWVGTLIGDPARHVRNSPGLVRAVIHGRSLVIATGLTMAVLFVLTLIEAMGIRFFGRRHGWRITRHIAWQICAHASVGWIAAAVLTQLSLVVYLNLSFFGLSGWLERAGPAGNYLMASVPLLGFVAGMLVFEVLVYMGMRRCRFANAPRE